MATILSSVYEVMGKTLWQITEKAQAVWMWML
jgi:hypothetical protein